MYCISMRASKLTSPPKAFTLKLEPELHAKATQKAAEMGLSLSQVLRFLLNEWLNSKQQKMFF